MAPGAIVEDLAPVEDRGGQFGAGLPFPGNQQLGLHTRPESFDHCIVERLSGQSRPLVVGGVVG